MRSNVLPPSAGREQDEVVGLIVARFDRPVLDRQFVAVDADQCPDLAGAGLPQPRLAAEESVLALEVLRLAFLRFVPSLAAVRGAPDEVRPVAAVVIDAQQQRAVGQLQHIARRVIAGLRLDLLRFDSRRLPGPASIGRAMQETAGVAPLVADIVGQQVPGDENRAILEHGQIRLAAEQVELLRRRPGPAAVLRAEQQRLLQNLVPSRLC